MWIWDNPYGVRIRLSGLIKNVISREMFCYGDSRINILVKDLYYCYFSSYIILFYILMQNRFFFSLTLATKYLLSRTTFRANSNEFIATSKTIFSFSNDFTLSSEESLFFKLFFWKLMLPHTQPLINVNTVLSENFPCPSRRRERF